MRQLRGEEVVAPFGGLGRVDDLYVDPDEWQVPYVVVAEGAGLPARRLLLSVACLAGPAPSPGNLYAHLSRAQIEWGAGAWPLESARHWLQDRPLCSTRTLVGMRIEARDGSAGRVADLLVDDEQWSIDYLIADSGRGAEILVPLDWLGPLDIPHGAVYLQRTREEFRRSPVL